MELTTQRRAAWPLLVLVLVLGGSVIGAAGACQGNSCPEMEEAARAAGLLGATGPILTSCSPKTYPVIGTLTPVRGLGRGGSSGSTAGCTAPGNQAGGRERHAPDRAARRSPSPPAYWRSSGRAAPTAPATKRRVGEPAASPAATRLSAWPFRLCTPACTERASRDAALQYIFALTADVDGFDGGPLWRSDNYGKPESWVDLTPEMQSEPGVTRPRGRGAQVQQLHQCNHTAVCHCTLALWAKQWPQGLLTWLVDPALLPPRPPAAARGAAPGRADAAGRGGAALAPRKAGAHPVSGQGPLSLCEHRLWRHSEGSQDAQGHAGLRAGAAGWLQAVGCRLQAPSCRWQRATGAIV